MATLSSFAAALLPSHPSRAAGLAALSAVLGLAAPCRAQELPQFANQRIQGALAQDFEDSTRALAPGAQATAPTQPPAAASQPPSAQTEPGRVRVEISGVVVLADDIEFRPESGLYVATGRPVATRAEDSIRGERLNVNPRTRQFTAEGDVVIRQGGQEFRAVRATYNFDSREGQADDVRAVVGSYFVNADELSLLKGPVYAGRRVRFSTCPPDENHYSAYTRLVEIRPGESIIGRKVGIDLLGMRIVTLPRLSRSLRPGDASKPLYPSFGYNSFAGAYVSRDLVLQRTASAWIDGRVQINSKQAPFGGVMYAKPGDLSLVGSLFFRDDSENQFVRNLQVSRLPEVGLVYRPGRRPQPGGFLSHQIYGVAVPRGMEDASRWIVAGELSAGYFRQHRGDRIRGADSLSQTAGRVRVQGQAALPLVQAGPIRLDGLRLLARQTIYDTGDHLTVAGVGIGKRVRSGDFNFSVNRFDQWTFGSTPFVFDNLELQQEWRPKIEYRSGGWDLSYVIRLRGDEGGIFDHIFSVSRLTHCLQPRFTYRARRTMFLFELSIPGFSSYDRVEVGTPASREREETAPIPRGSQRE